MAYRYDARGNTVRVETMIGTQTYVTEYSYDLADRLASMVYPSGRIVDYARDSIGRVTGVTTKANAGAPVVTLASGGAYQAMGPLNALTYGNGVTLANGFDLDGRLAAIDAYAGPAPILDLDHGFDLAGNITNIADAGGGIRGRNYIYDALYRLTQSQWLPPGGGQVSGQTDYAYDAVGNRTQFTVAVPLLTGVESYTLDAFSNRLVSTAWNFGATRALTHTASGNRATDMSTLLGSLAADYDSTDRLVSVSSGKKAVGAYVHNALGQRVSKTAGRATTHYLYDLSGNLIAEADAPRRGAASVTAEYVWLGGLPLAFVEGGAVYFVHTDHLGTPQVLTDGAAAVVWNADYAPFGVAVITGALTFNLRFPGQYFDAETGAHHNGFRTYDPSLGRYLESDPIGLRGGWNTYAYVSGNPVMRVDPRGLLVRNPKNYSVTLRSFYALQRLNACIGCDKDIIITDGQRGPFSQIGAGTGSQHVFGHAVDFKVPGMTLLELAQKAELCGVFGGIGWYEEGYYPGGGVGPHVHGDQRSNTARWGYYANEIDETHGYLPHDDDTIVSVQSFPMSCVSGCPSF